LLLETESHYSSASSPLRILADAYLRKYLPIRFDDQLDPLLEWQFLLHSHHDLCESFERALHDWQGAEGTEEINSAVEAMADVMLSPLLKHGIPPWVQDRIRSFPCYIGSEGDGLQDWNAQWNALHFAASRVCSNCRI
jgi:hypothetical protein